MIKLNTEVINKEVLKLKHSKDLTFYQLSDEPYQWLHVDFQEFTQDNIDNHLIKAAIKEYLLKEHGVECDFDNDSILYCIGDSYIVVEQDDRFYVKSAGVFPSLDEAVDEINIQQKKIDVYKPIVTYHARYPFDVKRIEPNVFKPIYEAILKGIKDNPSSP